MADGAPCPAAPREGGDAPARCGQCRAARPPLGASTVPPEAGPRTPISIGSADTTRTNRGTVPGIPVAATPPDRLNRQETSDVRDIHLRCRYRMRHAAAGRAAGRTSLAGQAGRPVEARLLRRQGDRRAGLDRERTVPQRVVD